MEKSPEHREQASSKPFEAIVVMPYGSAERIRGKKSEIDPKFGMSYETKMATLAALEAYENGAADKIILLGEQTYGKENRSTDEFMKEFLLSKGVPETDIVSYAGLNSTFEQIEKLSEQENENKYLIVSLDFHKGRVKSLAESEGVDAEYESAEELLEQRSEHYKQVIANWQHTDEMKKHIRDENIIYKPLSALDTRGVLQKFISRTKGPRKPFNSYPKKAWNFLSFAL